MQTRHTALYHRSYSHTKFQRSTYVRTYVRTHARNFGTPSCQCLRQFLLPSPIATVGYWLWAVGYWLWAVRWHFSNATGRHMQQPAAMMKTPLGCAASRYSIRRVLDHQLPYTASACVSPFLDSLGTLPSASRSPGFFALLCHRQPLLRPHLL